MRFLNFAILLPFLALGLTAWHQGDWYSTEEAYEYVQDGTCCGLYRLFYYSISIGLFGLSFGVLYLLGRHCLIKSKSTTDC
jgi:hypothetical protein